MLSTILNTTVMNPSELHKNLKNSFSISRKQKKGKVALAFN
jgi:hypothetical protein